jgi:periplasmic divalent cation tolerance protein
MNQLLREGIAYRKMVDDLMTETLIVLITADKRELAETLAERLVTDKLAACVNIIPHIESIYRWEGKICRDQEVLLIAKTERACYQQLEATVKSLHSYATPEIIALPIVCGSTAYLKWVRESLNI